LLENDMKKIGVRGWRKRAEAGDAWKLILKEARDLRGQWREWRERLCTVFFGSQHPHPTPPRPKNVPKITQPLSKIAAGS
jgi:hypothetical protein